MDLREARLDLVMADRSAAEVTWPSTPAVISVAAAAEPVECTWEAEEDTAVVAAVIANVSFAPDFPSC